jgi:hypothetical protein
VALNTTCRTPRIEQEARSAPVPTRPAKAVIDNDLPAGHPHSVATTDRPPYTRHMVDFERRVADQTAHEKQVMEATLALREEARRQLQAIGVSILEYREAHHGSGWMQIWAHDPRVQWRTVPAGFMRKTTASSLTGQRMRVAHLGLQYPIFIQPDGNWVTAKLKYWHAPGRVSDRDITGPTVTEQVYAGLVSDHSNFSGRVLTISIHEDPENRDSVDWSISMTPQGQLRTSFRDLESEMTEHLRGLGR